MWRADGTTISMTYGDFGVSLPFIFDGLPTLNVGDAIRLRIYRGEDLLIEKIWDTVVNKKVELLLTEEDTHLHCYTRSRAICCFLTIGIIARITLNIHHKVLTLMN